MRLLKVLSTRSRVLLYFFHFCSVRLSSFHLWQSPSAKYLPFLPLQPSWLCGLCLACRCTY